MPNRFAKSAILLLALGATAIQGALAQSIPTSPSADIPLQLEQSSAGLRLIINVGIGGGAPRPYLFDTGSTVFAADYNSSTNTAAPNTSATPYWGTIPSSMTGLPANVSLSYTGGGGYTGSVVAVPQLQFYNAAGTSQVTLNAPTTAPAGTPAGYQILAITTQNNGTFPNEAFAKSGFTGLYGTFGAGDFTGTLGGIPNGGVLGQAQVANTTTGYVVAANGQALSQAFPSIPNSPLNGPQVGVSQTVTSCNPCVMLGLTPALLAQFQRPIGTTVPWTSTNSTGFPLSGAPSSGAFGFANNFNFSLSGQSGQPPLTWTNQPTLLDTGTQDFTLRNSILTASAISPFQQGLPDSAGPTAIAAGNTVSITGSTSGALTSSDVVEPGITAPYNVTADTGSNNNTVGIPFFLQNSVLFNLAGQAVGYTPNFVTDASIGTSLAVGSNSPGLGLAGIIYDSGAPCRPGNVTSSCTSVTIATGGSATLSGANTYTGLTTVQPGGSLYLVGPGSIAQSAGVLANGTFDISSACAPGTSGVCGSPSGPVSVSLNDLSGGGSVSLGANNLTIQNAGSNFAPSIFSGVIADGGINGGVGGSLTLAVGSLTLSAKNTYTGGTNVVGGTLIVASTGSLASSVTAAAGATVDNMGTINGGVANDGTLVNTGTITGAVTDPAGAMTINTGVINGGVTIAAGSVLSNNGEIDGDVTDMGTYTGHGHHKGNLDIYGTIAASTAIGLTRVDKNLTFEQGSVYQALVDGKGNSDVISVGGAINIKGGTVVLAPTADFAGGFGSYTILSSDTAQITGQFASLSTPFGGSFYPFLAAHLAYTPSASSIVISHGASFASAAITGDQSAVGGALDQLPQSNALSQAMAVLNYTTAPAALTSLSADIYASSESVMQQQSAYLRDAVTGRLRQALGEAQGSPLFASLGPTPIPVMPGSLLTVWQQGLGAWGNAGSSGNATGISRSMGGYLVGLDAPLDAATRVGIASGFDQTNLNSTGTAASASLTGAHLAGYAGHKFGPLGVDFAASNTWYSDNATRGVAVGGFADTDRGSFSATATQVFGEVTWDQPIPTVAAGLLLQPFGDLAFADVSSAGMTETGGAAALRVSGTSIDDTYTSLGLRAGMPLQIGSLDLVVDGLAGWQHAFGAVAPQTALAFSSGGAPFSVQGNPIARDAALLGAGLRYDVSAAVGFSVSYSGRIAARVQDQELNGNLTVRF